MMSRDVPNPRDMRLHDLLGPFGLINYRLLLAAKVVQVRFRAQESGDLGFTFRV